MSNKKKTLSERLQDLADTTPAAPPEEDINTDSAAKLVEWDSDYDDTVPVARSKLRAASAAVLDGSKYAGRRVSRSMLCSDTDDSASDNEEQNIGVEDLRGVSGADDAEDDGVVGRETSDEEDLDDAERGGTSDREDFDDAEGEETSDEEDLDDDGSICASRDASDDEDGRVLVERDLKGEVEKGKGTKCQLALWDSCMELRINCQKLLSSANKLPQYDKLPSFRELGGKSFSDALGKTQLGISNALDKLLELQSNLLSQYPDTQNLKKGKRMSDDDEITSESENESDDDEPMPKRAKHEEYEKYIRAQHKTFVPFREDVIQKWNERTQLAEGKYTQNNFSMFNDNIVNQIKHTLADKERLRKRTRVKRTTYRVLGKPPVQVDDKTEDVDAEIFDDGDFYRAMVSDFIQRRNVGDGSQVKRKMAELEKLRTRKKRSVDLKASKGRRIRYDVMPRMRNFMAPVSNPILSEVSVGELFASLFRKCK